MSRREKLSQLDLLGNLIFVPSLTCLFLALQWAGSKYSWTNARIIGLLVVFVALLGLFVWQQYRKQDNVCGPQSNLFKTELTFSRQHCHHA